MPVERTLSIIKPDAVKKNVAAFLRARVAGMKGVARAMKPSRAKPKA